MRDAICLASGGLDSTVCMHLMRAQGLNPTPLFINYGQLNYAQEFASLKRNCQRLEIGEPIAIDLSGFGEKLPSGLTDASLDVFADAFTPCRNLLFIVMAAAFGSKLGINKIVMGLLSEKTAIFPDQTDDFISCAERAINEALGLDFKILLPLRDLAKNEVVELAKKIGVTEFYSCHSGTETPCGKCIACKEYGE